MINKITTIILILLAVYLGNFIYQREFIPCKNPITYSIGGFDSRFGISREKFLTVIKEAEQIWEKGAGRNLFDYQDGAKFKINLIFDERQEITIESGRSEENIESSRAQYDSLVAEYKSLSDSYERDLAIYNKNVAIFEANLSAYNGRVSQLNEKGGANPQQYKELEEERKRLEKEKSALDSQRLILNGRASELNSLGENVNSLAKSLNINVDIHNQRFGDGREFEQGQTVGRKEINIYQFESIGDLRLVLAHELGHARGLEHVENPNAIMYYLMAEQDIKNPALAPEDIIALKDRCRFE